MNIIISTGVVDWADTFRGTPIGNWVATFECSKNNPNKLYRIKEGFDEYKASLKSLEGFNKRWLSNVRSDSFEYRLKELTKYNLLTVEDKQKILETYKIIYD